MNPDNGQQQFYDCRQIMACPYCDLVFKRNPMKLHEVSICPRCHSKVEHEHTRCPKFLIWTLIAGLLFYFPANFLPLVTVEIAGSLQSAAVLDGVTLLVLQGHYLTAAIVLFCSFLVPTLVLALFSLLLLCRALKLLPLCQSFLVRNLVHLRDWSMLDIYLLSLLVTLFKVKDLGQVELHPALFAFAGLTLSINKLFISYDRAALWRLVSGDQSHCYMSDPSMVNNLISAENAEKR